MNSQEYQVPDTAAKTQAGLDALKQEDYQAETQDILGEKMVLNMGPSHPATHGVLRLILELDGENVETEEADATPAVRPLTELGFWELCRLGLAVSLPVAVVGLIGVGLLVVLLLRQ